MELFLNDEKLDFDGTDDVTLKEFVDTICDSKDYIDSGMAIYQILVDDDILNQEDEESVLSSRTLADTKSLKLYSAMPKELAISGLSNSLQSVPSFIKLIEEASESLRLGEESESMNKFQNVIGEFSAFTTFLSLAKPHLEISEEVYKNAGLAEFETSLLEFINEILSAQENNDWILIADMLEYEITPLLETWEEIVAKLAENLNIS